MPQGILPCIIRNVFCNGKCVYMYQLLFSYSNSIRSRKTLFNIDNKNTTIIIVTIILTKCIGLLVTLYTVCVGIVSGAYASLNPRYDCGMSTMKSDKAHRFQNIFAYYAHCAFTIIVVFKNSPEY